MLKSACSFLLQKELRLQSLRSDILRPEFTDDDDDDDDDEETDVRIITWCRCSVIIVAVDPLCLLSHDTLICHLSLVQSINHSCLNTVELLQGRILTAGLNDDVCVWFSEDVGRRSKVTEMSLSPTAVCLRHGVQQSWQTVSCRLLRAWQMAPWRQQTTGVSREWCPRIRHWDRSPAVTGTIGSIEVASCADCRAADCCRVVTHVATVWTVARSITLNQLLMMHCLSVCLSESCDERHT